MIVQQAGVIHLGFAVCYFPKLADGSALTNTVALTKCFPLFYPGDTMFVLGLLLLCS
jgi:hypothetical protein